MNKDIIVNLKNISQSPGVYLMKNVAGDVIYVGKAKNLKKRVSQYFSNKKTSVKTGHLVSKIHNIETIIAGNELDAFLLENNLIKQYKPKYNISLKDDKSYPYIKIAKSKLGYPFIIKTRSFKKGDGEYFGPYSSSFAVSQTIKTINKIFKLRICSDSKFNSYSARKRPCLYYQINRCVGPCCDYVSMQDYKKLVDNVKLMLKGKNRSLLNDLKKSMNQFVKEQNFEAAIKIRDKINAIAIINEKQVTVLKNEKDIDVIGFYSEEDKIDITVIIVRSGKVIDSRNYFFKNIYLNYNEMLSAFLNRYYSRILEIEGDIADEILIPLEINIDDKKSLLNYVKRFIPKAVKINVVGGSAYSNKYSDIMAMSLSNARKNFMEKTYQYETEDNKKDKGSINKVKTLEILKVVLNLNKYPTIMECFDISNISGTYAVASKAVFNNGKKDVSLYRKYKIRSKNTPDDYAMMYEVLYRRFNNAVQGKDPLPDIIVADGGKGQLNVLVKVALEFEEKGLIRHESMPVLLAISKAKDIKKNIETDSIYLPTRKNKINFGKNKEVVFLLMQLRDEAHRFAVSYYSKLKRKSLVTSELLNICGVGDKTYKSLMKGLGSVDDIKNTSIKELANIKGINKTVAKNIFNYFHK